MNKISSDLPASLTGRLVAGLTAVIVFTIVYSIGWGVYHLYFSELAGFPGPKLAAATSWYEFYYDCWRNGKYIFEIEKMHRKYGL